MRRCRAYFMPAAERERLRGHIQKEAWAKADHARLEAAAAKGDGYAAAFLYALDGDARPVAAAQKWLLARWGPKAYWILRARERLADGEFFKAGQPGIPEVYQEFEPPLEGHQPVAHGHRQLDDAVSCPPGGIVPAGDHLVD
jgi:hypothetical protein